MCLQLFPISVFVAVVFSVQIICVSFVHYFVSFHVFFRFFCICSMVLFEFFCCLFVDVLCVSVVIWHLF